MHVLPTEEQEVNGKTDYTNYVSPDADSPLFGMLAAAATRSIGEAMMNKLLRREGCLSLDPISDINVPEMKTYIYVVASDEA